MAKVAKGTIPNGLPEGSGEEDGDAEGDAVVRKGRAAARGQKEPFMPAIRWESQHKKNLACVSMATQAGMVTGTRPAGRAVSLFQQRPCISCHAMGP